MINITVTNINEAHTVFECSNAYSFNFICIPSKAVLYSVGVNQDDKTKSDLRKECVLDNNQCVVIAINEADLHLTNDANINNEIKAIANKLSEIERNFVNVGKEAIIHKKNSITNSDIIGFYLTVDEKERFLLEDNDHLQLNLSMANRKNVVELEVFKIKNYLDNASQSIVKTKTLYPKQTLTIELITKGAPESNDF